MPVSDVTRTGPSFTPSPTYMVFFRVAAAYFFQRVYLVAGQKLRTPSVERQLFRDARRGIFSVAGEHVDAFDAERPQFFYRLG